MSADDELLKLMELDHDELVAEVVALRLRVEALTAHATKRETENDNLLCNLVMIAAEIGAPSPASYAGVIGRIRALRALETLGEDVQKDLGEALQALGAAKVAQPQ